MIFQLKTIIAIDKNQIGMKPLGSDINITIEDLPDLESYIQKEKYCQYILNNNQTKNPTSDKRKSIKLTNY